MLAFSSEDSRMITSLSFYVTEMLVLTFIKVDNVISIKRNASH